MALTPSEIQLKLEQVPEWQFDPTTNQLVTSVEFATFLQAVDFIVRVAKLATDLDHHPDFSLFNERFIRFTTITKSENGLTDKDFELANQIDQMLKSNAEQSSVPTSAPTPDLPALPPAQ